MRGKYPCPMKVPEERNIKLDELGDLIIEYYAVTYKKMLNIPYLILNL